MTHLGLALLVLTGVQVLIGLGFLLARAYYNEEHQRLARVRAELEVKAQALEAARRLGQAAWHTRRRMYEEARRFGRGRLP